MGTEIANNNHFILYVTEYGKIKVDVLIKDETIWLTINHMAELFSIDKSGISRHIKNIYKTGELKQQGTVAKFATVQNEGQRTVSRQLEYYNLDMIISVGYRVNSIRGSQFRIWSTQQLKELIIKGFVLNDEKLKNPDNPFGKDYFDNLLERIRDIRSSEKRFYRKITDIYALSVDYEPKAEETLEFFKTVQNKLHFAISGKTAAEIIMNRADAAKDNMGLTSWQSNKVRKSDVTIAKNYLNMEELEGLNRIVTMYLDYAEEQARRHRQMFMKNWRQKLDAFLQFNERDILVNPGKISHEVAKELAEKEYNKFHSKRIEKFSKSENDFDKAVKLIEQKKKEPPNK